MALAGGLSWAVSHHQYVVRMLDLVSILVLNLNPMRRPGVRRTEGAPEGSQGLRVTLACLGLMGAVTSVETY